MKTEILDDDVMAADTKLRVRYALIMPVRDEENFLPAMAESVISQAIQPKRWIIVDDGSRDRTPEIARQLARNFSFIQLICLPNRAQRLPGGEGAIPSALRELNLREYDYLARFDSDLILSPDYMEKIFSEFEREPRLGIAGGGLYIESPDGLVFEESPEDHIRGALKMYKMECFEEIGGMTADIGWDTIDEVEARSRGWITQSYPSIVAIHRRPTGTGIASAKVFRSRGRAEYLTWSHPLFVFAKAFRTAWIYSPRVAVGYLYGFASCYLRSEERKRSREFIRVRRKEQMQKLKVLFYRRQIQAKSSATKPAL